MARFDGLRLRVQPRIETSMTSGIFTAVGIVTTVWACLVAYGLYEIVKLIIAAQ